MAAAPLPTPNYIDYTDNVLPLIGTDKVLVSDAISTGIPTAEANQLIADGESIVLADLSPYYVTVPELVTTTGGTWDTLPSQTYTIIYNMFVYQAAIKLIRAFIQRNSDRGQTLGQFVDYYSHEYAIRLNRIIDVLPNGAYRYQLIGLQPLNTGIQRTQKRNVRVGTFSSNQDYTGNQLTNPQNNFNGLYPFGAWGNP